MRKHFILLFSIFAVLNLYSQKNKLPKLFNPDNLIVDDSHDFEDEKEFFLWFYYDTLKYNPLFMPLIFDGQWQPDTIVFLKDKYEKQTTIPLPRSPFDSLYITEDWKSKEIEKFIRQSTKDYVYANYPLTVKYNQKMLPEKIPEQKEIKTNLLKNLFTPEPDINLKADNLQKTIPKEVFWWKTANNTLNVTQNYVSDNWSKGGESNLSLLNIQNLKFGYNDKKTFQFETEIECKFSFYSSPNDTIRSFRVNDDATFLKSKLGYKAFEKFYYTFSTEFRTQLFNNYKANSTVRTSSFLSPANLYMSLGLDYKLKNKKINMSVILSPISYRLIYVGDPEVDETAFGVDKGKYSNNSFGSMLTGDLTFTFNKQINWVSRLYYYTTYEKTEAEWENTFNFVLNRYLSTKFIFHGRFDDSAKRSNDLGYFQIRENLSFGLSYKW